MKLFHLLYGVGCWCHGSIRSTAALCRGRELRVFHSASSKSCLCAHRDPGHCKQTDNGSCQCSLTTDLKFVKPPRWKYKIIFSLGKATRKMVSILTATEENCLWITLSYWRRIKYQVLWDSNHNYILSISKLVLSQIHVENNRRVANRNVVPYIEPKGLLSWSGGHADWFRTEPYESIVTLMS
jgi:hypothetical protein